MRVFACDNCDELIYFDNSKCLSCDAPLGYVHGQRNVIALSEARDGSLRSLTDPTMTWQRCGTATVTNCNWLVPAGGHVHCESCELTRTRPADAVTEGMTEFVLSEMAKRRLIFQLAELNLPVTPRDEAAGSGLAFDLLSSNAIKVVTGHDDGIITLDLSEADDAHREHLRLQFSEPYRTLLGHFRHEIGHYYWPILVTDPDDLAACRELFGDERVDYGEAVARHYDTSEEDDESWKEGHISRYATMHPYEDWAETFAHYLHILDTLQTAESFGLGATPVVGSARITRRVGAHPTRPDGSTTFQEVIGHWLELSYALNQINRSMGQRDLYPFVLAPAVIDKMAFVDTFVHKT